MNATLLRLVFAAGALLLAVVGRAQEKPEAPDKNFYVFLCFGQSNMEGFPGIPAAEKVGVDSRFQVLAAVDFKPGGRYTGPERKAGEWYPAIPPLCRSDSGMSPADYFGRTVVANTPKEIRVGVVSVAVAGCKIEMFDKVGFQAYMATWKPGDFKVNIAKQYGNNPYQRLVDLGKQAQKVGVIKGILLHQGESNNGERQWPDKVKAIYGDLLKDLDLKAEDVPLLVGELVPKDQGGACAGMNTIIDELANTIPTAHVISAVGCTPANNLHFDPAGYKELGTRYGVAMIPLLGYKPLDRPPVFAPPKAAAPAQGGRGRGQASPPAAVTPVSAAPVPATAAPALGESAPK